MTKEDIISLINIKDYNNVLEGILDTKDFSEDVKNLLLSMLYKIENSYKDYETIKGELILHSEKQYLKELLNTINNCNKIILGKPNSKEAAMLKKENRKYKIDEENGSIIAYQNEQIMLQALEEFKPKEIIIKEKYSLYEKGIKELLSVGFVANNVEVIRDFNGWSWDINEKQIEDVAYNLVYQNMLMIFGSKFINCMINNCSEEEEEEKIPSNEILRSKYSQIATSQEELQADYIEQMGIILEEKYGKNLKEKLEEALKKAILVMISNRNEEERNKIQKLKEENSQILEKMQNKVQFLGEVTGRKKDLITQIKEIDNVVNDTTLLKEEYEKINKTLGNKDKIFSPSHLANRLITKRKQYMKEINKINKLMEPKEFVKVKEEKEKQKEFFEILNVDEGKKIDERKIIEELQLAFLDSFKAEILREESKKKILDLIYKLRYYELLPYNNIKVNEIKAIKEKIEEVEKSLIERACEKKVLTKFSEDGNLNYKILKNIFTSKIINLESIILILKYNKDILSVEIYDGNIIEETANIKIEQKTELSVKLKKKIKLFI